MTDSSLPPLSRRVFGQSALASVATALAGPSRAQAPAKAPVTLGFATVVQGMMSGYYNSIPMTLFWPPAGLDIRAIGLAGANTAAEMLEAGRTDVTLFTNSALFALLDKHPDTDVVAVYTFVSGFNALPVVQLDSPLRSIKDLQGKRVGVQSLGNSQLQVTRALMSLAGGDPASIQFVPVGEGVEAAHALQTNRVDAASLFDGAYAQIEGVGVQLRELEGDALDLQSLGFISAGLTTRRYLEKNRAAVVELFRGIAQATVFAKANPEAAVRIHWKIYPESRPRGIPEEEAMRRSLLQVNARMKNVREVEGLIGNSTIAQINFYQELLLRGGIIQRKLDPARFWDPSLLKEINDFDRAAIRKQAENWKG